MRNYLFSTRPDNELGGISEITAREIRRGIGLLPGYDIENLVVKFRQAMSNLKDVMICATYPNCTAWL